MIAMSKETKGPLGQQSESGSSWSAPPPPASLDAPPPAYTSVAISDPTTSTRSVPHSTTSIPTNPNIQPTRLTPTINILLLGSPNTGKSTFLSRLPHVTSGPITSTNPLPKFSPTSRPLTLESSPRPLTFSVSLFRRPYNINIYPSLSPLFIDPYPSDPNLLILTYDITSRSSLHNAQYYWRRQFTTHYPGLESVVPILLLGLKRDLRTDERGDDGELLCVMPEEGVKVAGLMRCDRYAECSAVTGELLWEAVEDITRMAALSSTGEGAGKSGGGECIVI